MKHKISAILNQVKREERVEGGKAYRLLGIRLDGKGAFFREEKLGGEISAKYLYKVRTGDFAYSRLFGWRGSFAIIPEELDGHYVSNEFPIFQVNATKAIGEYVLEYFLLPSTLREVERYCTGTTQASRNRFKENKFLNFDIELPSLPEQNRRVSRMNEFRKLTQEQLHTISNQAIQMEKLKQAILSAAVRGELVPQDPDDEPAEKLLERIKAERDKHSKKQRDLPPVSKDEEPYPLPKGWVWTRLGAVLLDIYGGGTPSKENPSYWNGSIPWASVKDLNKSNRLKSTQDSITEEGLQASTSKLVPSNSIIVCTRMGLGKIVINEAPVAINQDLKALVVSTHIQKEFLLNWYKTVVFSGKGTTVAGITQQQLLQIPLPLASPKEQKRVCEKIYELSALCDQLETELKHNKSKSEALLTAVLREAFEVN